MPTYGLSFNPRKRSAQHLITTVCGVEGCGRKIGLAEAYRLRVPAGGGGSMVDARPRSVTGGRIGAPAFKRASFTKTTIVYGCVSCSLKYENVRPDRKPNKTWRIR